MATARKKRILIMTAVEVEKEAVLRGLRDDSRFDVQIAGVGPISAAISTTTHLTAASSPYDLVISAGIAGGFVGQAEIGSIVVASEIIAADLGAETPDGFSSLDELGFGDSTRISIDEQLTKPIIDALHTAGLLVHLGPILTLSTVTGTSATAEVLTNRVAGATAEGMEGYGVASAGKQAGLPVLEIRSISNAVGPRDRAAWQISDALKALESAFAIIKEVL